MIDYQATLTQGNRMTDLSDDQLDRIEEHDRGGLLSLLVDEIRRLQSMLADCFRATGADPDGNEDWRLAEHALQKVVDLRHEADAAAEMGDAAEAECDRLREAVGYRDERLARWKSVWRRGRDRRLAAEAEVACLRELLDDQEEEPDG